MTYDYAIIGGGPSGIFCADKLSLLGYKVCLIESLESLGGCHRVRYVRDSNGTNIHTEHGPRIYLGAYIDFWKWIQTVGVYQEKHFTKYITSALRDDILGYSLKFSIRELVIMTVAYIIQNICRINFSESYTIDDMMRHTNFSESGKERLNRICRLIDGGNTDKTTVRSLFKGLDTGLAYSIYEPTEPMDTLIWEKFNKKLTNQGVNILLNTSVRKIDVGMVSTDSGQIPSENTILCIPPVAIHSIKNASRLVGYEPQIFQKLSNYQQYEPYVCATVIFANVSPVTRWGIAGEHPWGLIDIDMGRYFKNISGSMFIVSVTHPEKIDPETNKRGNDMNEHMFLERIVDIIKKRFNIKEDPVSQTLSPNVRKVNGKWIEIDRAFLYSPPGWLKPDMKISNKNRVWTTGHHIGNSHHEYNSMESAVQNASELLRKIIPEYSQNITRPLRVSTLVHILFVILITVYVYLKKK